MNDAIAGSLLDALRESPRAEETDLTPGQEARPTPEQKALIERLARLVDEHAAELGIHAEILAPRGEIKALAMGERDVQSLGGWRRGVIGEKLLEAIG